MNEQEAKRKQDIPEESHAILYEGKTEMPYTGKYYKHDEDGMYTCAGCGATLFSSDAKFDSGSGWPSFDKPENTENIELRPDDSLGMRRTEVVCKNCGGHLGHVFEDGPKETTGQRFCINSLALDFEKKEE